MTPAELDALEALTNKHQGRLGPEGNHWVARTAELLAEVRRLGAMNDRLACELGHAAGACLRVQVGFGALCAELINKYRQSEDSRLGDRSTDHRDYLNLETEIATYHQRVTDLGGVWPAEMP